MADTIRHPLVSVLIPVYNCENYVSECLDSIISQDYDNLQIVVYNDGSTDGSYDLCKRYAEQYDSIELYSNRNKGVATARNELLNKIKGEFFIFVDADDWIESNMISYLCKNIIKNDCDICTCEMYTPNPSRVISEIWDKGTAIREFLCHKRFSGSLCIKLCRTSLIHNHQFCKEIYYGEDALFVWHLLQHTSKVRYTNKSLYHYRCNPESISRTKWTPERKGSGMLVWQKICDDVKDHYPQYLELAYSRSALEAMWGLYFASISKYPLDEQISMRQEFVKKHLTEIKKYPLDGLDKYITATIISKWYGFGKVVNFLNELKHKF